MKTVDVNNVSIPNFIVSFRGLSENDSMAFNERLNNFLREYVLLPSKRFECLISIVVVSNPNQETSPPKKRSRSLIWLYAETTLLFIILNVPIELSIFVSVK